ncbi:MAG TPA: hypothetical protein VHO71_06205 [Caproiciproducens sp.]|nr:hypothetical protein [Caproiciproducens sp.]
MKIENISVGEFIGLLEHAKGNIYLVTDEGVYFNLSSKLSQLYCAKMLLNRAGNDLISPNLQFEKAEDEYLFNQYTKGRKLTR